MKFIDSTDFEKLLKKLSSEGELFVPVREEDTGKLHMRRVESFPLPGETVFDGFRAVETLKGFAQHLRSEVATYPSEDKDDMEPEESFPGYVIVGAKGCDLKAMGLVDRVQTEGDYVDPFYKIRRDKMLVIASDCSECSESCFCNLTGSNPWPEEGYDLAIAKVGSGFLVEDGSERGAGIIGDNGELFSDPREGLEKTREENREKVLSKLKSGNKGYPDSSDVTEPLRKLLSDGIWIEESAKCVECGACTNICPTCYCFLLFDQDDGEKFKRVMSWDSCQVSGYARMAGMGTPRPRLSDRVKHRFYHKYDYLPLSHNAIFCTGCGRCIDACSAGIDMRDVFSKVVTKATR